MNPGDPPDLAARTLIRGANIGLPTGQDVAQQLGIPRLDPGEVATPACKDVIDNNGFDLKTPLWYMSYARRRFTGVKS